MEREIVDSIKASYDTHIKFRIQEMLKLTKVSGWGEGGGVEINCLRIKIKLI